MKRSKLRFLCTPGLGRKDHSKTRSLLLCSFANACRNCFSRLRRKLAVILPMQTEYYRNHFFIELIMISVDTSLVDSMGVDRQLKQHYDIFNYISIV